MAKKSKFMRETESLQTAVQNNAVKTNRIKAKIVKTQENSKIGYVITEMKPSVA